MLNRRTPLKRTPFRKPAKVAKRGAYIRKVSAKKRKEIAETRDEREAFKLEMGTCCLCPATHLTVHEIFGGAVRHTTVRDRRFWLACCWSCHLNILQDMPKEDQLRIKKRVDPKWFDKAFVNALWGGERYA